MAAVAVLQPVLQEPSEGVTQLAELFDRAAVVGALRSQSAPVERSYFGALLTSTAQSIFPPWNIC